MIAAPTLQSNARGALSRAVLAGALGAGCLSASAQALQNAASERGWSASGEICIRLARFEDLPALVVGGSRAGPGQLEISRSGDTLTLNGESATRSGSKGTAAELWIEPRDPRAGLTLGALHYPGRLRVRVLANASGEDAGLAVDNIIEFEDYVAGVVAAEVQLIGAADAELEAQAIASRSFALAQLSARGARSLEVRLFDTTRDQAYAGLFVPTRDPRSQAAASSLAGALERTRGKILVEEGLVLDARFHAACGGRTASAADVFPEAAHFAALRSVDCEACLHGLGDDPTTVPVSLRDISWRTTLSADQLDRLARSLDIGAHLLRLKPVRSDRSGRWLEVELTGSSAGRRLPFEQVRRALKNGAIASNLVLVTLPRAGDPIESSLMLTGRGRGHGVGLCQNGAHAYALHGWSSEQILAHYYPGSTLVDGR